MRTVVGVSGATLRGMKNKEEGVVRYSVDLGDKKQKNGGHRGAHVQAVGKHRQGQVQVDRAQDVLTTLKILIIGEHGVGKSRLLLKFPDDTFNPELAATIGVDFKVK